MPRQAATIGSLPQAFEVVKEMQADGPDRGRGRSRRAVQVPVAPGASVREHPGLPDTCRPRQRVGSAARVVEPDRPRGIPPVEPLLTTKVTGGLPAP